MAAFYLELCTEAAEEFPVNPEDVRELFETTCGFGMDGVDPVEAMIKVWEYLESLKNQ